MGVPRATSITVALAANSANRHSVRTRWKRNCGSCCREPTWRAHRAVSIRPLAMSIKSALEMRPAVAAWTSAAASRSRPTEAKGASSSQPKSWGVSFSKMPESAHRLGAPPEKIEQYTVPPSSSGVPRASRSSSRIRASSNESIRTGLRRRLSYQVYPGMSASQP